MGGLNNKSNIKDNKNCFENENNLLNSDNNNYGNIIFIPLISAQIIQFLVGYDKKIYIYVIRNFINYTVIKSLN